MLCGGAAGCLQRPLLLQPCTPDLAWKQGCMAAAGLLLTRRGNKSIRFYFYEEGIVRPDFVAPGGPSRKHSVLRTM